MKYIVTGGAGFIGSHLVDALIKEGHYVIVLDNILSGDIRNINPKATFYNCDIRKIENIIDYFTGCDGVFHLAAIARTPWCIDDPILAYETNVMGTLNILEASRKNNIKRIVMTSSNVIYAFWTPYRSSKESLESLGKVYTDMYNLSVICLRNSNVYGQRQSELGPSPNVFSALRKCKKDKGVIDITGDGTQSRDFTHVSDIVNGHIMAMNSNVTGVLDLCTGVNHTLNDVVKFFDCNIKYIDERPGDVKHIFQDPLPAFEKLGWKAKVSLAEGMKDFFNDKSYLSENRTIIFLTSYRSRKDQTFRREQLITMMNSIKIFCNKNNIKYKVVICEQNDNNKFNRGKLLNAAFIESEKQFMLNKIYFHINVDYQFNMNKECPKELLEFDNGFFDLYKPDLPVLGAACLFDSKSYTLCNGFPNDLIGWGGDDWAIYNRIITKNINYVTNSVTNSGFIIDIEYAFNKDGTNNAKNMELAKRHDDDINGVSTCEYNIDGNGEFHNDDMIFHYLLSI
jgi:UDP-glucose 4-epimerase